ncbi:MAG TPA: sugar transferase [Polyangiaceae bacterium]|jgi:exopolysaccharide biosynthesis polyprenyl glycosylphosphotransferase
MSKQTAQNANLVGDCLILVIASAVATRSSSGWHWMVMPGMAMGSIFVWMLGGRVLRHYDVWNGRGIAGDVVLTTLLLGAMLAVMGVLRWFVPQYASGSDLERFVVVAVPAVLWLRLTTSWLRRREVPIEHVLIVGVGPLGRHTGLEIRERNGHRRVFGYLRFADEPMNDRLPAEVLGLAGELEAFLKKHVVSEVFLASSRDAHRAEMQAAIHALEGFGIPFALPACGFRFGRARPEHEHLVADGYVHYLSVRRKPVQQGVKRAFDILASTIALALLSPLMLVVAFLIKATSRGSLLFKQNRVGLHGRAFHMLKFRSMVANAEELKARLMAQNEQQGPVFKMRRDPRITAVGRFIRKYSIDELPQLINVLRGEMSIVGPRPPIPSEVEKYEAWQRRRLSVRPGLTCVWQVSGRNQISFEEWMYLDMQYIDHWSLAQDFQLILKTVPVVLTGRGAS